MRRKQIFVLLILVVIGFGYTIYEKMKFISSHKSPNNKYELIIKRTELISNFIPTMPGQGGIGDKFVIAILRYNGREINRSQETFLYQSLEIKWDLKQNKVHYTRLNYFTLLE